MGFKGRAGMHSDQKRTGFLNSKQIKMIDEALSSLGGYGEVRLIVKKGTLRFVVTQQSYDALKWQPTERDNIQLSEEISE